MSRETADGLANLAHAVRRSTALYCAIITSDEGTPDDAVLARADKYAAWLRGKAGEAAEQRREQFLGEPVDFNG